LGRYQYFQVEGGFLSVEGGFPLVEGGFLSVEGGFLSVEGGFLSVEGGFLLVEGGFLSVEGEFFRKAGAFRMLGNQTGVWLPELMVIESLWLNVPFDRLRERIFICREYSENHLYYAATKISSILSGSSIKTKWLL